MHDFSASAKALSLRHLPSFHLPKVFTIVILRPPQAAEGPQRSLQATTQPPTSFVPKTKSHHRFWMMAKNLLPIWLGRHHPELSR
jgi:hypothetical protein